jgi:hypothetical protein
MSVSFLKLLINEVKDGNYGTIPRNPSVRNIPTTTILREMEKDSYERGEIFSNEDKSYTSLSASSKVLQAHAWLKNYFGPA